MNTSDINGLTKSIDNLTQALNNMQGQIVRTLARNRELANSFQDTTDKANNIVSAISSISGKVNSAINKVISSLRKILAFVKSTFNYIGPIVGNFKSTLTRIISLFGNFGDRVKSWFGTINNNGNILSGTATELKSKIDLICLAFDKLFNNEFTKKSEELYQSIYSLKNIVGSELTQSTINWANNLEKAFGLSAKGLVSDLNELSGILTGLGFNAEQVSVGSENILMMSRYLAFMGAAGGDATKVVSKLQSGLAGSTRAIRDLGLSVSIGQMDDYLKSLKALGGEYENIGTSFNKLTEQQKNYVRYSAIVSQFINNYDIRNFSQALDTATGRITIFRESIRSLQTTVGQVFTEAFGRIAGYITYIIKLIEQAIIKIAGLFGLDLNISSDTNKSASAINDLNDSLDDTEDTLDGITQASKDAQKALLGFDKVTKINDNKSSNNGEGIGGFDYSSLFNSALDELDKIALNTEPLTDKLKENFDSMLKSMSDKFNEWAKDITGRDNFNLGFNWSKIKTDLGDAYEYTKSSLEKIGRMISYYALSFADDFNIGDKITRVITIISKSAKLLDSALNASKNGLLDFYDKAIKPLATSMGLSADNILDKIEEKLDDLTKWFENNEDIVTDWWNNLADKFNNGIKHIKEFYSALTGKDFEDTNANTDGTWNTILNIVNKLSGIMKELWEGVINPLLKDLGSWGKNEFLPWLNDELGKFGDWLTTHKDQLVDLIERIGSFAWEGFKEFVDVVGKLVNFAVEHPDAVKHMFEGIIALKVASWFTGVASSIARTVLELKALSAIKELPSALTAINSATTAGTAATAASSTVGEGFTAASTSVGALVAEAAGIMLAIAGVIDGVTDFVDASKATVEDEKKKKVASGTTKIGSVATGAGIGAAVGSIIPGIGTAVGAAVGAGVGGITGILAGDKIGELIVDSGIYDSVSKFFTETVPKFFSDLWDGISKFFTQTIPSAISSIGESISKFFTETIPEFFSSLWDNISEFFSDTLPRTIGEIGATIVYFLIYQIPELFSNLWDDIVTFFAETIPETFNKIKEDIKKLFEDIKLKIKELWNSIIEFFTKTLPTKLKEIKEDISKFFEDIPKKVQEIWDGVIKAFTQTLPEKIREIKKNISQFFDDAINKIKEFFSGALDGLRGWTGKIKEGFNNKMDDLVNKNSTKKKASVSTSSVKLTEFAGFRDSGGSIPRGSTAIVNEGGNLEMLGKMPGGQSVAVNNRMITDAIADAVTRAMIAAMTQSNSIGQQGNTVNVYNQGPVIYDDATINDFAKRLKIAMESI